MTTFIGVLWPYALVLMVPRLTNSFQTRYTSAEGILSKIHIDREQGWVFVGGQNSLLKFDTNLNLLQKTIIGGPRCDNQICDTHEQTTNNNVSVLELLDELDRLLVCGTGYSGRCYLHNVTDIKTIQNIEESHNNSKSNRLGSSSTFVFKEYKSRIDSYIVLAAMSYGGRDDRSFPYIFSERDMLKYGDKFLMKYVDRHPEQVYIEANEDIKSTLKFDFIYGFQSTHFIYIIRTGRNAHGNNKTVVSEVNKKAASLKHYIESEITCGGLTTATSGYYEMHSNRLYLTFHTPGRPDSALCEFNPQTEFRNRFNTTLRNCTNAGVGEWPFWIKALESDKQAKMCRTFPEHVRIFIKHAIENRDIYRSSSLMTSVAVSRQDNVTTMFLGHADGKLKKLLWSDDDNSPVTMDIGTSHVEQPIDRNMRLSDGGMLYMTHGDTVTLVDTHDCHAYNTCLSCLGNTFNCTWCSDMYNKKGQCLRPKERRCDRETGTDSFNVSCPPVIDSFSPTEGPIYGGTVLQLFVQIGGSGNMHYNVTVVDQPCHVINATLTRINCRISRQETSPKRGKVIVMAFSNETNTPRHAGIVPIDGTIESRMEYSFKKPLLSSIRPTNSMVYGNIPLTVYGQDLNIGSTRTVTIGNKTCHVDQSSSIDTNGSVGHGIVCKIPEATDQATGPLLVRVYIDGRQLNPDPTLDRLTYVQNPVVNKVTPRTIIQSGGTYVTLIGENLQGVGQVYITSGGSPQPEKGDKPCSLVRLPGVQNVALKCKTARLPRNPVVNTTLDMYFHTKFGSVDGAFNFTSGADRTLRVRPNPKVSIVTATRDAHSPLVFEGSGFDELSVDDVTVTVGSITCNVTKVTNSTCSCTMAYVPVLNEALQLKISIGYYMYTAEDQILFKSHVNLKASVHLKDIPINVGMIAMGTIFSTVAIVIVIVCVMKRTRSCHWKEENDHYAVTYRADGSDVMSFDGVTDTSQNRLNLYQEQSTVAKSVMADDLSTCEEERPLIPFTLDSSTRSSLDRENLIIERDALILGEVIGQGHFGCVYKGYWQLPGEKAERIVAAKTLHRSDPKDMDVQQFIKEAVIMKNFHHRHVMELLGLCVGLKPLPLVILPYMQHGDLLTYLRDNRNLPTVKDLVTFGVDIADGMCYLSELKFVHRDLAARNCMLNQDLRVKVADFGLTRDVYEKEYYSSNNKNTKLPVKWMAPESLEYGVYTSKSDIWSYGVVLWELLTRGINPYPEVDNWDILRFLKCDRRMAQPSYCPEKMYRIMRRCWMWEAIDRPSFGLLSEEIPDLLRQLEHTAGERGKRINIETTYVNVKPSSSN